MPLEYRNFKAWIYCDDTGDILEEFKAAPDPEDERVYNCWVASEAGKRFTVHWENLMKAVCDNKGVTFVDGVETHSYVNIAASNKDGASHGVKTATGGIRPYSFSDVVLTDDDAYLGVEQSANTDELGNITLKIYLVHARLEPMRRPRAARRRPRQFNEVSLYDGAIHETTKKICGHRITLGDAIQAGPPRRDRPMGRKLIWESYDPDDTSPHVTFRFRYRPRAYLQAQGIIPVPPSTAETPQKPVINNNIGDGSGGEVQSKNRAGQKRKRAALMERDRSEQNIHASGDGHISSNTSLFLSTPGSSLLCKSSQAGEDVAQPDLRSVFFESPRAMKDDEDVVIVAYTEVQPSERKRDSVKENGSPFVRNVRTKREPFTPVKGEGMRLWMDSRGVIDLTLDD